MPRRHRIADTAGDVDTEDKRMQEVAAWDGLALGRAVLRQRQQRWRNRRGRMDNRAHVRVIVVLHIAADGVHECSAEHVQPFRAARQMPRRRSRQGHEHRKQRLDGALTASPIRRRQMVEQGPLGLMQDSRGQILDTAFGDEARELLRHARTSGADRGVSLGHDFSGPRALRLSPSPTQPAITENRRCPAFCATQPWRANQYSNRPSPDVDDLC